jgi:putative copper resistance protein D
MNWLGAEVDVPLVVVRAIHFAATAIVTGTLIFRAVVSGGALHAATPAAVIVRRQTLGVAWIGLAISAATGLIWLLLEAVAMSGLSFREVMTADMVSTVLNKTQFGFVTELRLAMAVVLVGCLACDRSRPAQGLGLTLSLGLVAAIAWTGHAGSTPGDLAFVHLGADTLHLVAAAAWIGGLVSLALLLSVTGRDRTHAGVSFARQATERFSTMGIAVVAVIFATGLVNAWILVGSLHGLIGTGYGRLLLLKVGLFVLMFVIAAINRVWLTPRLARASAGGPQLELMRRLTLNSVIEIVLALMIFGVVGVLGTLHPAVHTL